MHTTPGKEGLISPREQVENPLRNPADALKKQYLRKVLETLKRGGEQALLELLDKTFDDTATDDLTGLFNRRVFYTIVERMIVPPMRRRMHGTIEPIMYGSLVMIDLDHFKTINEMYGHAGGNDILRVFGKLLMAHFRENDVAGRVGGDEFVVVAVGLGKDEVERRMQDLQSEFRHYPWELERIDDGSAERCVPSFSFNVVAIDDPDKIEDLLRKADRSVFDQKRERRVRERRQTGPERK